MIRYCSHSFYSPHNKISEWICSLVFWVCKAGMIKNTRFFLAVSQSLIILEALLAEQTCLFEWFGLSTVHWVQALWGWVTVGEPGLNSHHDYILWKSGTKWFSKTESPYVQPSCLLARLCYDCLFKKNISHFIKRMYHTIKLIPLKKSKLFK